MKTKILTAINIVLFAFVLCSIVSYYAAATENKGLEKELKIQEQGIASADELYKRMHTSYVNTADEISALNRELEELSNIKNEDEIRQFISEYVNIRYNYNGSMQDNSERILNELEEYVDYDYLHSQIENNITTGIGNHISSEKRKKVKNFCTADDVYFTTCEYDDGSDVYMSICELHDNNSTTYREISAYYDNGSYKINYDVPLATVRT